MTTPGTGGTASAPRGKALAGGGAAAGGAGAAAAAGAFIPGNSVTGAAEGLMNGAFTMAASAGILPPALMIAFQFKLATAKPQNLEKAAGYWESAAKDLENGSRQLKEMVDGIPQTAWNMDDRAEYERTVDEYCLQLDYLHNYCMAVHYALIALAWALFAYAIFAIGVAAFLVSLVVAAGASLGTMYGACVSLAQTALSITYVVTGMLGMAGHVCAAVLAGGTVVTAKYQADHGNGEAWNALKKAAVTGSAGAAANLLQSAANTGLAFLNRSNGERHPIPGTNDVSGSRGFPLQEIDLDADRKYDTTWNVGGGAKVKMPGPYGPEVEVSGHRQYGPEGYAGSDFELKGKQPGPGIDLTGGVKKEWDENGDAKTTYGVGAEQPHSGVKAGYEKAVEPDGKAEDKASWVTPWGSQHKNFDPPWK
ncbi:hypothetical protein E1287_26305 [Actinomadura sp. KC06]|uniref:hypothetical protein n=1 Tax=Actinomadura sp. KC06 TaxID=2530369 RepID=UPI001053240A|nr:hypothetical protein [Actinomadura sp. KC06]TDD31432.1 hypothetical protein E1287_26305 [Actinomadura sp. KC06]